MEIMVFNIEIYIAQITNKNPAILEARINAVSLWSQTGELQPSDETVRKRDSS